MMALIRSADADVNWLIFSKQFVPEILAASSSGIFQVIYFQWPPSYMSSSLHTIRVEHCCSLGTTSPAADGFVACSLVTIWLCDELTGSPGGQSVVMADNYLWCNRRRTAVWCRTGIWRWLGIIRSLPGNCRLSQTYRRLNLGTF